MIGLSCNREDQCNVNEVEKPCKLALSFTAPPWHLPTAWHLNFVAALSLGKIPVVEVCYLHVISPMLLLLEKVYP